MERWRGRGLRGCDCGGLGGMVILMLWMGDNRTSVEE